MLFKLTLKNILYFSNFFYRNIYLNYDYVLKYCNFPIKTIPVIEKTHNILFLIQMSFALTKYNKYMYLYKTFK